MLASPAVGDHFHVPGDTADVRCVRELMWGLEDEDGVQWLVRSEDGSYFVLTRDEELDGIDFRGRRIVQDQ